MTTIDKIVFSQNTPAKNTLWARPSEKGTELLIFNKGKWGTVGADDFQRFHYEVYSSLEDITEPKPNALYLIGPKGEGEDKYDEYVYTEEGFTKIGDTSIDMSDVIKYTKYSDGSYTLKAEGEEIKKLRTTDDSTVILGDNNSIEFGASGTINMQSGNISGVKDIQMTFGKIDNVDTISGSSEGMNIITAPGPGGVGINGVSVSDGSISEVAHLIFKSGGTLTPSIDRVQDIFGKNGVHISMSGSYPGAGIDFGKAPLKNIDSITMTYLGTLDMNDGRIDARNINIGSGILAVSGSSITISGSIHASGQILNIQRIFGVSGGINMNGGAILDASSITLKSGGTLTFGDGTTMSTASQFSGTLRGTIENTTFGSGNTFTTGFVDELKTALGIS